MRALVWILIMAGACGGHDETSASNASSGGGASDGCAPGEETVADGSCVAAGIDACAEGFTSDGADGCVAVLPATPCGVGEMAVPGDDACHRPAACGNGAWGDIPVDASTEHVDASYTAPDADGSAARPWPTVQAGIDAAAPGAIVAIALGSYLENVDIYDKAVRLWGRCPEMVEIVGSAGALAAVLVESGASGSEIRGLAIRGAVAGLAASGSEALVASGLWIHDTASRGIDVEDDLGPTAITVSDTLVESAGEIGIFVGGASAVVERTLVRGTKPGPGNAFGDGIQVARNEETGTPGDLALAQSLLEANHDYGLFLVGVSADVERVVIRNTLPQASDGDFGRGIGVQSDLVTLDRGTLALRDSVLEANTDIGLVILAADATVERTVVRDTLPNGVTGRHGRGIEVDDHPPSMVSSTLDLARSVVSGNGEHGIVVFGAAVTVRATVVRATQPRAADGLFGRGVTVQVDPTSGLAAHATLLDSRIIESHDFGLLVMGGEAAVHHVEIGDTLAAPDATDGDGIAAAFMTSATHVDVAASLVRASARAGVAAFGAVVDIAGTSIDCALFPLNGQALGGVAYELHDGGANHCGCGGDVIECKVLTTELTPPAPLD
jgi:hypothetical protein